MPLTSILSPFAADLVWSRVQHNTSAGRALSKPIIAMAGWLTLCAALPMADRAALAEGCLFEPQGEGRVVEILDGRSFRLADGREIRLAGIESAGDETTKPARVAALAALIKGQDVTLLWPDDRPDRYGRQSAIVMLGSTETPVQGLLLRQGDALVSTEIVDKDCATELGEAEAEARHAKKGVWTDPAVIKNAESSGNIVSAIGQFVVVEGMILSVRQLGTTTYLNFGRSWTHGFAAIIPGRTRPALETAGILLKSLENRRIRVRGFVEARPGPRIDVLRAGQIEILGSN
jgi:endonuclease YncB( thermonuclease family)